MEINTYLSIILNVHVVSTPIKRVTDWIKEKKKKKKSKSLQYGAYKRLTLGQRTHKLKVRDGNWNTPSQNAQ